MNVNAILLKPLDGYPVGSPRSLDKADFERLKGMGAVREAADDDAIEEIDRDAASDARVLDLLRHPVDGPKTLAEMKARFEQLGNENQALRDQILNSDDVVRALTSERDTARADHATALSELDTARTAHQAMLTERDAAHAELANIKAAQPPANKMDPAPANKAAGKPRT